MQMLAASGSMVKAIAILNLMKYVPGKPTVYDYNSMIYCYFNSGYVKFDELFEVYIAMKRFGPNPNASTFNTLLSGLILVGRLKDGILIAQGMMESGFLPSYNVLSKFFKKFLNLGSVVESLIVLEIMLGLDYIPRKRDMIALIHGLCKGGMIQQAYFVLLAL
ncbi:Hypothetical predicted protein [Olea europaea subsp. europaea]|uniref:Pentatricopeptide repeat-containing protein n=1 Tax=Olea europaea subsp. europaea TaxID=158383 RepID=A0A8S0T3Q4_OLEEU|nr:Hypothetical predicted protein [Olea europaea subsp. europaea]